MNIIKNPIFIALILGGLTYLYMYYDEQNKRKMYPSAKQKPVNIITPGVVAILAWFISSSYLDSNTSNTCNTSNTSDNTSIITQDVQKSVGGDITNNSNNLDNLDLHLVEKNNIRLPECEVLLELMSFE